MLKAIPVLVLLAVGAVYGLVGISTTEPGEVGLVVTQFGEDKGVRDTTLNTGMHWYDPFKNDVIVYDTRFKQYEMQDVPAGTQDGQPITVDVSFEVGLRDAGVPQLHETIGPNYIDQVVWPAARAAVRTATGNQLSDAVYTGAGRAAIQDEISNKLQDRFDASGIVISSNLRDIEFLNKDFVNTLEEKAKAAQQEEIQRRMAAAAAEEAIATRNRAEGERFKREQAADAQMYELQKEGEGERLKQEEIAAGIRAIARAEADGIEWKATALMGAGGALYRDIEVLGGLGEQVEFYGVPTGAEGTNTYIIDEALRGQIAVGN